MTFTPIDYLPYDFANRRHIGPSPSEMNEMFKVLGVRDLDELIDQTIPRSLRQEKNLNFGKPKVRTRTSLVHAAGGQEEQGVSVL
jgi:glycine dehydrogenase